MSTVPGADIKTSRQPGDNVETMRHSEHERAVAIHECGHTLMAYLCNVPFLYVSIEAVDLEHGRFQVEDYPDCTWDLTDADTRHATENAITVWLAGYAAQRRDVHGAGKYYAMHATDHSEAWKWCQLLNGKSDNLPQGSEATELYFGGSGCCPEHIKMTHERFDDLGQVYHVAMQSLVTALLDRGRLSDKDVIELLTEVGIKSPVDSTAERVNPL